MNLKSRENIAKILGLNESVFKIGDIYKVKPIIDVPKSLINSFVSKAKKEQDVDPREMWSDMDIAELMVNYIMTTYLTADNISVEAIMGEKKPGETVTVAEPQVEAPIEPVKTEEVPTPEVVGPQTQEETKIASIPATLQVEAKEDETSNEKLETFMLNTELTDTLKEHLKENKISFEKVSGILELKCTKEQLTEIKKLF